MTEQKLKELLADMTLEEKVNQMSQVVGAFFNKDMDITAMGPMADKGFTPENVALSGSILGSMGAEMLKKIQKDFVEQHPHHIPMLFMLDVINGFKTIFRFRWDRAQRLNRSSPKSVRQLLQKRQPFPAFT